MRRLLCLVAFLGLFRAASASGETAHAEMAAALAAQADLHPTPASLPTTVPHRTAVTAPTKRAPGPQAAVQLGAHAAAQATQQAQAQGASTALAHQAAAAAAAAAGQAQAKAAKDRASHPHPIHR